jgi:SpoVK/Ycf46/Vps4 family AAA+-type ATPase
VPTLPAGGGKGGGGGGGGPTKRKIHLVIFDEIDSLVKARGRGNGQAADSVYDGITNTLLSKMDGMNRLSNLLIIGTTNRKDLLDDALLRPGRFDLQIEIPLPDAKGREEILKIHTRRMGASGHLAADVDLGVLARDNTDSFTGAELEGAVKSAASFAVERALRAQLSGEGDDEDEDEDEDDDAGMTADGEDGGGFEYAEEGEESSDRDSGGGGGEGEMSEGDRLMRDVSVTQHDLLAAVGDVEPQHRAPQAQFRTLLGGGLIHYGPPLDGILATLRAAAARARRGGVTVREPPKVVPRSLKKKAAAAAAATADESTRGGKDKSGGKKSGGGGGAKKEEKEVTYDSNTKWASGVVTVLLHGPAGCGKSAVAAYIAREANFAFSKVITADSFLDDRATSRADQLTLAFDETRKHKESLLLLDDVDGKAASHLEPW